MIRSAILVLLLAGAVQAQEVGSCDDFRSSAQAIAEPWEENTRMFANGEVRLAILDTIEPAAGAFHPLILSPPHDEVGGQQCAVVSASGTMGFGGLDLAGMETGHDPARGLIFAVPATRWVPDNDAFVPATLSVTLNQSTGAIDAALE